MQKNLLPLIKSSHIQKIKTPAHYGNIPLSLLPEKKPILAVLHKKEGNHLFFAICSDQKKAPEKEGTLHLENGALYWENKPVSSFSLFLEKEVLWSASSPFFENNELVVPVETTLQGALWKGRLPLQGVEIVEATPLTHFSKAPDSPPPWLYFVGEKPILPVLEGEEGEEVGILLAKNFQDTGVKIGDRGFLSYQAATASSIQEQRVLVFVAGFYDPGLMSVGAKCILVPPSIAQTVNASSSALVMDKSLSNGIQIWIPDLEEAKKVQIDLRKEIQEANLHPYWTVSTFYDYDFAKDLLQQFQSDKYLFTLIGILILTVACCNIISLLMILVNNKRKEIGILQAMGARKLSIAYIFGGCGMAIGVVSVFFGVLAALVTLHNLDSLIHLLSFLQGHELLQSSFYGSHIPNQISYKTLLLLSISTPLLSLIAGLIPALKACSYKPSELLRFES